MKKYNRRTPLPDQPNLSFDAKVESTLKFGSLEEISSLIKNHFINVKQVFEERIKHNILLPSKTRNFLSHLIQLKQQKVGAHK